MVSWTLSYRGFDPPREGLREALCTLGNGYFATRGAAPEAHADGVHYPGTYVAGCYNRLTSEVAGRRVENEDLVNLPNWLPLTFRIDGEDWFAPPYHELLAYQQELDLRRGVLTRLLRFRDRSGRTTRVTQRRLVSMDDPHLAALETTIVAEDWSGRLDIRSALDGRVANTGVARYRGLNACHLLPYGSGADDDGTMWLRMRTTSSDLRVAEAARTRVVAGPRPRDARVHRDDAYLARDLSVEVRQGQQVTAEKVVALFTSRDRAMFECAHAARMHVRRAGSFDALLERHALAWDRLWRRCALDIGGGDAQRTVDLHMFHLLQTLSQHTADLDVGVPARGLHGEAYRGHVFWDELFVFPFLTLRFPETARALLLYRWRRLGQARHAAREAGYAGAMFPWQSGSDGREESQRVHLNPRSGRWLPDHSHLQRHVGIAVAYNVWQYYQATGDVDFLAFHGAEMLLEIARFWSSIATYNRALDRYEIRGVMGPDEYHDAYPGAERPGLHNNAYTNLMAVWVLRRALDVLDLLPEDRCVDLCERLGLTRGEQDRFDDISRNMRVVFHGDGIISQFEGYADLDELDWSNYRRRYGDIRRLDRILEAEGDTPNRYQLSKQADVLMLFYLLSAEELGQLVTGLGYPYSPDLIAKTIDYYLARIAHGSTLSAVVHAWVLARSDRPASWQFFTEALGGDVRDAQGGTTAEGIHLGAMGGSVDLVQRCYAGLETRDEVLRLNPRLPRELRVVDITLRYRGHWGIRVRFDRERVRISLPAGNAAPIRVAIRKQTTTIEPGDSWEQALPRASSPSDKLNGEAP